MNTTPSIHTAAAIARRWHAAQSRRPFVTRVECPNGRTLWAAEPEDAEWHDVAADQALRKLMLRYDHDAVGMEIRCIGADRVYVYRCERDDSPCAPGELWTHAVHVRTEVRP